MAYALIYLASCSLALSRPAINSETDLIMVRSSVVTFVAATDLARISVPMSIRPTWSHLEKVTLVGGGWVMISDCGRPGRICTRSLSKPYQGPSQNRSSRLRLAGLSSVDRTEAERDLVAARTILGWYADASNYEPPSRIIDGQRRQAPVMRDRGSLARKILAHLPKGRHDAQTDQSSG